MEADVDRLRDSVGALHQDVRALTDRVEELGGDVSKIAGSLGQLVTELKVSNELLGRFISAVGQGFSTAHARAMIGLILALIVAVLARGLGVDLAQIMGMWRSSQ